MTGADIDAEIRAKKLAFEMTEGRLVDEDHPRAHPTFCNHRFCVAAAVVAVAHALTAADVAAVLRTAIDTGDDAAWRSLVTSV